MHSRLQNQARRQGLTLIESMAALAMLAIVGSAMMLSTQGAVTATSQSIDEMIAAGIAAQYLDEAMGLPYCDPAATSSDPNNVMSASLGHGSSTLRGDWVDLDDYAGVQDNDMRTPHVENPPLDPWGRTLGTGAITKTNTRHPNFAVRSDFFTGWRIETNVYYVADSNSVTVAKNESSYTRVLAVQVYRNRSDGSKALLASLYRVHSHVPKSP